MAKFRLRGHRDGFDVDVEGRDQVVIYAILAFSIVLLASMFAWLLQ